MANRPLMLPEALLEDADQIRRVVEEELMLDVGDASGAECLSPDSIDQVGTVEAKDHFMQVREISIALVREFLASHRRECRDVIDVFEAAMPREARGLTKRSAIARLVRLEGESAASAGGQFGSSPGSSAVNAFADGAAPLASSQPLPAAVVVVASGVADKGEAPSSARAPSAASTMSGAGASSAVSSPPALVAASIAGNNNNNDNSNDSSAATSPSAAHNAPGGAADTPRMSILERLVSTVLARGFGHRLHSVNNTGTSDGWGTRRSSGSGAAVASMSHPRHNKNGAGHPHHNQHRVAGSNRRDHGGGGGDGRNGIGVHGDLGDDVQPERNSSLNFGFGSDGASVDINGFSVGQTSNAAAGANFSVFSLQDLSRDDAVVIGHGAGGRVLKMRHVATNEYYAVKEIVVGSAQTINEIKKEISVLWGTCSNHDDLPSPFLITCHGIFYEHGMLYIVMDLMACSLKDALEVHGAFEEHYLKAMFYQVLHGLHYLHHTKKQLHRDIKPHNILISDMGSVKISDFGIASERVQTLHHNARLTFCGTLSYMSPGRAEGLPYSFEADIWGVGMSLYQLAVGELPEGSRSVFAIAEFRSRPPRLPTDRGFGAEFMDFVALCLQPEGHATVKDLLVHPWMRGMTLERSQRNSAEVARAIVSQLHSNARRDEDGLNESSSGVDALAALDDVCGEFEYPARYPDDG